MAHNVTSYNGHKRTKFYVDLGLKHEYVLTSEIVNPFTQSQTQDTPFRYFVMICKKYTYVARLYF